MRSYWVRVGPESNLYPSEKAHWRHGCGRKTVTCRQAETSHGMPALPSKAPWSRRCLEFECADSRVGREPAAQFAVIFPGKSRKHGCPFFPTGPKSSAGWSGSRSSRGPGSHFQHPQGSSQPLVTAVPGDPTLSWPHGHQAQTYMDTFLKRSALSMEVFLLHLAIGTVFPSHSKVHSLPLLLLSKDLSIVASSYWDC